MDERSRLDAAFSEDAVIERMNRVTEALASFTASVVPLPYKGSTIEMFNRYVDFASTIWAEKLLEFSCGAVANFRERRYGIQAHCMRAVLENSAVLHHLLLDESFGKLADAWSRRLVSEATLRPAADRLHRFTHGNNFQWDALDSGHGKESELLGNARPTEGTVSQVKIGREAMAALTKTTPGARLLYNALCDMVHPNLGSNLMVLTTKTDRAACGQRQRSAGVRKEAVRWLGGIEIVLRDQSVPDLARLLQLKLK
ncbi:MAG: hypothetical protein HYX47_06165 [Burkholderiales bacterium]|nr:hypothetical protein [Burkholderiales bacterium]